MGVALELVNFDEEFFQKATKQPIIINDFLEATEAEKSTLNQLIYTKYATDLLSNLPSCECGDIVGEHNVGVTCTNCNTQVASPMDQTLEPLCWIRAPHGVKALINPVVWLMLAERFTKGNYEVIRWFCDTTYKPIVKFPPVMETVMELGFERGYNNFIEKFDEITSALFELKEFRIKKGTRDTLRELLTLNRQCIFSTYLPLPNRALLVIEETNVGTYVDPIITDAIDAIRTMVSIDSELSHFNVRTKENRTVKTISQLANFYNGLYKSTLSKKEGIFRKHVFGTRSHWSFRAVISSLTDKHRYDEIHIPWGVAVSVLRIHLVNKLYKHGYTPNEAIALLNAHANEYHPLLDQLFKELIAEAPDSKGIPCVLQRNPSLQRASAQALYITQVKTDPKNPTISLSIIICVGYNADKRFFTLVRLCSVFILKGLKWIIQIASKTPNTLIFT